MSIKDIFNRNRTLIKGSVVEYQEYGPGNDLSGPGINGSGISSLNNISTPFPLTVRGVNYVNPTTKETMKGGGPSNSNTPSDSGSSPSSSTVDKSWAVDIAQSHHFTIQIRNADTSKGKSGNLLSYKVSTSPFGDFLPVKSMNLMYSGYETMVLPFSSFADFPLLQRRKVEVINLTCYDEDTNRLEDNLMIWNNECFPEGKYVAYMDNVVKELIYRGFTVDGRERLNIRRYVIPIGQPQVTRDYEENGAKLITFSLACVGNGSTCATGATTREQHSQSNNNSGSGTGSGSGSGSGTGSGSGSGSGSGNGKPKPSNKTPKTISVAPQAETTVPINGGDSKKVQVLKGAFNYAANVVRNVVTAGFYSKL